MFVLFFYVGILCCHLCTVIEQEYLVQGVFKCLQGGEAVLGLQFALARFFIASHTVALLPPLRVTIAKKLTDNDVIPK